MTSETKIALTVFGVIAGILLGFLARWTVSADYVSARVYKLEWSHATELRERKIYHDGTFWDVPSTQGHYEDPTFNQRCYMRQHGTYCAHYDSKYNCTMYLPDYDEYCEYDYYDWPVLQVKTITGEGEPGDFYTFRPDNQRYREEIHPLYTVFFESKSDQHVYRTESAQTYRAFVKGDHWQLKIPHVGSPSPVKRLTAELEP